MKTTLRFILTLFTFVMFVFAPNGFAQEKTSPEYVVRVIYFHPNDRQPQPDAILDGLLKKVQQFYANEMERHGFGRKTFRLETDETEKLIVHRVKGKFDNRHYYYTTRSGATEEIYEQFDTPKNMIYLIWRDLQDPTLDLSQVGGVAGGNAFEGEASIGALNFERAPRSLYIRAWTTIAHELGHAFGLKHDFRDDYYIMSYGLEENRNQLSYCAAEWLDAHRYFNTTHSSFDQVPKIEMLSSSFVSPPNTIRLRFGVTHSARLHQAQLLTNSLTWLGNPDFDPTTLLDCKSLDRNSDTIEFVTTELVPKSEYVTLKIIDVYGNFTARRFPIDITSLLPDSKPVSIPDANLAAAIREDLGLAPDTTITQLDMLGLGKLSADGKQIADLTGLEHATNLTHIVLNDNQIVDLTPIAGLTQLRSLLIIRNEISDIRPLAGLTQLRTIWIWDNQISDISPLAGLTNLITLLIGGNQISDISPLAGLTNLHNLHLQFNQISDVSPLIGLTKLDELNLWSNQISDISPLVEFTNLDYLNLVWNPIENQKPLLAILRKNPNVKIFLENLDEPLPVTWSHSELEKIAADVNSDGIVNIQDLVLVASNFLKTGENVADVNNDGIVNIIDLTLVAGTIGGEAAAPSAWHGDLGIASTRDQVEQWLHQARQMNLTDSAFQRGVLMLEQLLAALTPKGTILLSNYPNPFNPETWIPYQLAEPADVSISVYSADGKLVLTLELGHQPVGIYESRSRAAYWDGRNALGEPVASGVYFYTLSAGDFTATRRMLIQK